LVTTDVYDVSIFVDLAFTGVALAHAAFKTPFGLKSIVCAVRLNLAADFNLLLELQVLHLCLHNLLLQKILVILKRFNPRLPLLNPTLILLTDLIKPNGLIPKPVPLMLQLLDLCITSLLALLFICLIS
jgi:hypothetical protein